MRIRPPSIVLLTLLTGCTPEPAPQLPAPPASVIPAAATASVADAPTVAPTAAPPTPPAPVAIELKSKPIALPGVSGAASLDYLAYERATNRVWVPVGNTGSVDVLDIAAGTFTRVDGFTTAEREVRGKKRTMGPSAVTIGDGFAYVGNRASSEICPVELKTLKLGKCLKLTSSTDGVAFVASAKEVWVTTPRDKSLTILDASKPGTLKAKSVLKVDGDPEGYAVDDAHGLFFTNLEDKAGTVVIDIKSHKTKATWKNGCGTEGPRGIAVDGAKNLVFVACTDHLEVLDGAHDGALLSKLDTGAGVDNIDYDAEKQTIYVGAGKAAKLTIAKVDDKGVLALVASGATSEGARNGVVDKDGTTYLADGPGGRVLVMSVVSPAK